MADYDNRVVRAPSAAGVIDEGLRAYMLRVYNYMSIGLVLTALAAYATATIPALRALFFAHDAATGAIGLTGLGWIALFAPFAMVLFLSFRINRMSVNAAQTTFWAYAALMGVSLTPIIWIYTATSIAQVFFITAATFGAMSLWGYTTKTDLTGFGSFLFMGLIGLVIASIVNIFLRSTEMMWILSVVGVLIFTGLTAWDTQQIKYSYSANDDGTVAGRKAIFGALRLYLDFVNLFLMLLRLMGVSNRR